MDIRKVKKLIELLEESGIAEIEITEGEESVRISRYSSGGARSSWRPTVRAPQLRPRPRRRAGAGDRGAETPSRGQRVTAPMVGTFYAAPSPGAKAFVESATKSRSATRCASSKP